MDPLTRARLWSNCLSAAFHVELPTGSFQHRCDTHGHWAINAPISQYNAAKSCTVGLISMTKHVSWPGVTINQGPPLSKEGLVQVHVEILSFVKPSESHNYFLQRLVYLIQPTLGASLYVSEKAKKLGNALFGMVAIWNGLDFSIVCMLRKWGADEKHQCLSEILLCRFSKATGYCRSHLCPRKGF